MSAMTEQTDPMVAIEGLHKTFTLHTQNGATISALQNVDLRVSAGECVVLRGASGAGKSSLLRCVYGNYRTGGGAILVRHQGAMVDVAKAEPRTILAMRRTTMGFVSQFLRVIPRIPTLDLVMEPLLTAGRSTEEAEERAAAILAHLNLPQRLWSLAPATFSGGEQQRVNIARAMVWDYPVLLLDEPTASLDRENRAAVVELILAARSRGAAILGVFHDREAGDAVATDTIELTANRLAA